jgi:hypothetical protein
MNPLINTAKIKTITNKNTLSKYQYYYIIIEFPG